MGDKGMRVRRFAIYVAAVAVALMLAATALAGSGAAGYAGKAAGAQATVTKSTHGAVKGHSAGTLPFTGLDLTFIVGGGVVLLLAGVGFRRAGRNKI
jgi:hypothetical protein